MTADSILALAADTEALAAGVKDGTHGASYAAGEITRILGQITHALKVGDHAKAALEADRRARAAFDSIADEIKRAEAAAILGAMGGAAKSARKSAAARANGRKGGRPRKA